jgi:hypothetical protein
VNAGVAEQDHDNEDDHDQPYQAVSAAPIVATAISVIPAASAKQQKENDDQQKKAHGAILIGAILRAFPITLPLYSESSPGIAREDGRERPNDPAIHPFAK